MRRELIGDLAVFVVVLCVVVFFFNDTATTEIYTLSLHDALPIFLGAGRGRKPLRIAALATFTRDDPQNPQRRSCCKRGDQIT